MSRIVAAWAGRIVRAAADLTTAGACIWFLGTVLWILLWRWRFPFELEWMEAGSLGHVLQVLEGRPIYAAPSIDFTPYMYNPLYYYVSAISCLIVGAGLPALRLVSLLSFLCCLALLGVIVFRETKDWLASAAVAPGFFAATFVEGGSWFDIARVDTFMLALLLGAVAALQRTHRKPWMLVVGGALLYGAFFSKQIAAVPIAVVVLFTVLREGRRGLVFAAVLGTVTLATVAIMDLTSDGWYRFYAFLLPRSHEWVEGAYRGYWADDMMRAFPIAILAVIALFGRALEGPVLRSERLAIPALVVSLLVTGWLGRLHSGGYLNVIQPAHAGLAIALAVVLGDLRQASSAQSARLLGTALIVFQLAMLRFDPAPHIPAVRDHLAGQRLVEQLREIEGEIYAPDVAIYPWLAGHRMQVHAIAIEDLLRGGTVEVREEFLASFREAVERRHWTAALFSDRFVNGSLQNLVREGGYRRSRGIQGAHTLTGMYCSPYVMVTP